MTELIFTELIVMDHAQVSYRVLGTEEKKSNKPLLERMCCLLKESKGKHASDL